MARETQHFLSAREKVKRPKLSGATDEDEVMLIMDLYRKKAGLHDKEGVFQFAPPFNFIDAADYLSLQPKFGGRASGQDSGDCFVAAEVISSIKASTASARDVKIHEVVNEDEIEIQPSSRNGPVGIKRSKRQENDKNSSQQLAKTLAELSKKMDVGNDVLLSIKTSAEEAADAENDNRLLLLLDKNSQEYQEIMHDMLRDRRLKKMKKRHNDTGNTAEVVVKNTEAGSSHGSLSGAAVQGDVDEEYIFSASSTIMLTTESLAPRTDSSDADRSIISEMRTDCGYVYTLSKLRSCSTTRTLMPFNNAACLKN